MKGKQTMFFAISDDLDSILKEVEKEFDIEYVEMGSFETNKAVRYFSFSEIANFGFTEYGDWAGPDHRYMIVRRNAAVRIREVAQLNGGVRFLVDPMKNPDSIELTTKGIYAKKENVIVAGRTGMVSETSFASSMYKALSSKIKKKFKRIGVFYVGPKAEERLREGWRLVQIEKSPKKYDLTYLT